MRKKAARKTARHPARKTRASARKARDDARQRGARNRKIVRGYLEEVVSGGDLAAIDRYVAPDVTFSSPYTPEPTHGIEPFREMIRMLHTAFPDMQLVEEDVIAEGDRVASRWTVSGTHSGDFMGHPPSGRRYEITGMSIYRISRGRIVEGWVNDDSLGMLRQLGIVGS